MTPQSMHALCALSLLLLLSTAEGRARLNTCSTKIRSKEFLLLWQTQSALSSLFNIIPALIQFRSYFNQFTTLKQVVEGESQKSWFRIWINRWSSWLWWELVRPHMKNYHIYGELSKIAVFGAVQYLRVSADIFCNNL